MKRTSILLFVGLLAVLLLVLAPALVRAATTTAAPAAPAALAAAEQLYTRGEYALAAASYRQLSEQGASDSRLFYNMGLSYLKAGDLAQALWSLRSAAALAPRDADTAVALAQVRAALAEQTPALAAVEDVAAPVRLAGVTTPWLTPDELAWIALALWSVLAILLLLGLLVTGDAARRLMRGMAAATAAGLVAVLLLWGARAVVQQDRPAVVVAASAELRSGPGASFTPRTTLPAGAEVAAAETRGAWVQVVLPGGAAGWLPTAAVALVRG
jgi:tetratricopeptide (TPR) repeat protein